MTQEIFGIKIYVTADLPKMQLSDDCPVTPEFRIEINKWMLDFFGATNLFEDNGIFKIQDVLFMNPRTATKLKNNPLYNDMKNYYIPTWTEGNF